MLDELYGTPLPEMQPGRDVVLEIDVQGAQQIVASCEDVLCVLVLAPSIEAQAARLRARGDPEQHVQRRVELGLSEVEEGRLIATHTVVNDDVDSAVAQLLAIIEGARDEASPRP